MDSESIFTIVFVLVVLSVPFALGVGLFRSLGKIQEIENLYLNARNGSGRVVGYTERIRDPDNTHQYYAIIEYKTDQGETVWAESEGCHKDQYNVNARVEVLYHPRDKRRVMILLGQDILKARITIDKYIDLSLNILMTLCVLASGLIAVFHFGYAASVLSYLAMSYVAGVIIGMIFRWSTGNRYDTGIQSETKRNERLGRAQTIGKIPCYIKE